MPRSKLMNRIRLMIGTFVLLLILSGVTAFPVYTELKWIIEHRVFDPQSMLGGWMQQVWQGVQAMHQQYPELFYGYDWLAFAHIVIGMAFIGPFRDPVKNSWIIDWGMLCCVAVIPLALIAGPIRQIPWYHIVIDCSFGIIGIIPLWITKRWIKKLETMPLH
jgi:hypothetical protein